MNPIIHMNHAMQEEPEYTPPPTDPIAAARHNLKGALALRHTRHTGERRYWTRRAIQCLTDYRAIREPVKSDGDAQDEKDHADEISYARSGY